MQAIDFTYIFVPRFLAQYNCVGGHLSLKVHLLEFSRNLFYLIILILTRLYGSSCELSFEACRTEAKAEFQIEPIFSSPILALIIKGF